MGFPVVCFALLCFFACCSGLSCPAETSQFCRCVERRNKTSYVCQGPEKKIQSSALTPDSPVRKGFLKTNGKEAVYYDFRNSSIHNLELSHLELDNCPVFDDGARLNAFVLRDANFRVDKWDWSRLCRVRSLRLTRLSSLTSFSLSGWQHGQHLYSLTVAHCPALTTLWPGALATLTGALHIDLSHNALTLVTRSALPDAALKPTLRVLDLSHNHLSALPDDLLSGFPELILLNLNSNRLLTLRKELLTSATPSLNDVYFYDNPYANDCDCSMEWLVWSKTAQLSVTCNPPVGVRRHFISHLLHNCGPNAVEPKRKQVTKL